MRRHSILGFPALVLLLISVTLAGCGGASKPSPHILGLRSPPRVERRLAAAGCSTAVAGGPTLKNTQPRFVGVRGAPFGVAVTPDGRFAFVGGVGQGVGVFSLAGGIPHFLHVIRIPTGAVGISLTRDGRFLLIADGRDGAEVIDVARAEAGQAHAVLGDLSSSNNRVGGGAIEVRSSPDDRFVFVSVEVGRHLAVYNLRAALASHFRTSGFVGVIPVGVAPVGLAVSPDGRWLYSTSEADAPGHPLNGTLKVINLLNAEHDPAHSVVATANAHCSPVRVAVSPDGSTVWVTARESDQLLAFSAARLVSQPGRALEAAVRVGEAPVGLALVNGARQIVVADSNRFNAPHSRAELTVVSAAAALAHRPAILGTIRTGRFPREMDLDPSAKMLIVGNFMSDSLEAIHTSGLDDRSS